MFMRDLSALFRVVMVGHVRGGHAVTPAIPGLFNHPHSLRSAIPRPLDPALENRVIAFLLLLHAIATIFIYLRSFNIALLIWLGNKRYNRN